MSPVLEIGGRKQELRHDVYIVSRDDSSLLKDYMEEEAGRNSSVYLIRELGTGELEHGEVSGLEAVLNNMGWEFKEMVRDDRLINSKDPVESLVIKVRTMGEIKCEPMTFRNGELKHLTFRKEEPPLYVKNRQKDFGADGYGHTRRTVSHKLREGRKTTYSPNMDSVQGANLAAELLGIMRKGPGGQVVYVDPSNPDCQQLIDGPLLALLPYMEQFKLTVLVNDATKGDGSTIVTYRPYFKDLQIGNPGHLRLKVE